MLTDNETSIAEVRRARFFICWMDFHSGLRSFADLTIVSDQLAHREAIKLGFQLAQEAVTNRQTYQLTATSEARGDA